MRLPRRAALALACSAASLAPAVTLSAGAAPVRPGDDATVVAVIDSGFNPYHWDFLASKMPQAATASKADDLPLTRAPHEWLRGFPSPKAFKSYQRLDLTLEENDDSVRPADLDAADTEKWKRIKPSSTGNVHYTWLPRTKVIGAISFASATSTPGSLVHAPTSAHGMGTSSVAVGNIFGACPECLVLFIQYRDAATGEQAINWAMDQPWIDVITNSYGFSKVERDRVYNGSDVKRQRAATERGQSILFSAGNGISNTFTVPNSTLTSSQEGPDWILTVGATDPNDDDNYTGTGKPADIAGVGRGYPSSYNATGLSNGRAFSGTSNSTPTIAGTYARALNEARRVMAGPSRTQSKGVISTGAFRCGRSNANCALGDGRLTERELRARLLLGAQPTPGRFDPASQGVTTGPASVGDSRYLSEGHGIYRVRLKGDAAWQSEFRSRLLNPLLGTGPAPARPADEVAYMRVDSFCRQHIWGEWTGGYFVNNEATPLPARSQSHPFRTAYHDGCQQMQPPPA
jgi:hypothetical protein